MASLRYEDDRGRSGWRLQFRDEDKRNRSVWLGDTSEAEAQRVKQHVEHLLDRTKKQQPPEMVTADWLGGLEDDFRNKLARCGLCESVEKRTARVLTLGDWLTEYIGERKDVKAPTVESYEKAQANLLTYFGPTRLLRDISAADAAKWRIWLKTEGNRRDTKKKRKSMADDTVRRRTGTAKQFFKEAIARGYIKSNPFAKLPSTTRGNAKRQSFVPVEAIELCMPHCSCLDWRTILALARLGGLRCPSELVVLRWTDVDLPGGKMIIHAPKTEHHDNGGVRVCPIFPELRPYLEAAWDAAPEGTEFVINRYRRADQNLRETFLKILKRAGVAPWPRLFQNLRASRETELMARYPAKDVSAWLGNSVPVAMRHYAMATDESFLAAAAHDAQTVSRKPVAVDDQVEIDAEEPEQADGGCIGGCIPRVSGAIGHSYLDEESPAFTGKTGLSIVQDSLGNYYLMGVEGLEPPTLSV